MHRFVGRERIEHAHAVLLRTQTCVHPRYSEIAAAEMEANGRCEMQGKERESERGGKEEGEGLCLDESEAAAAAENEVEGERIVWHYHR